MTFIRHPELSKSASLRLLGTVLIGVLGLAGFLPAQDRLQQMPGYAQYQKMRPEIRGSVKLGTIFPTWKDGGKSFEFALDGKLYRYDIAARKAVVIGDAPAEPERGGRPGRAGRPERGRQFTSAVSPDGKHKAFYRDRNLWIGDAAGDNAVAVTTEGKAESRTKFGTASWVYGEELGQITAMWWSPDSRKIAYYGFDESRVPDYYLQYDQTKVQDTLDVEPYVKVGAPNPVVDIWIHDLVSGAKVKVDVRDGKPFDDSVVGHYIYDIAWSPDGRELLFHRTNRRQHIMEFAAADPATGACRVVVREEWPPSFTENSPEIRFLKDGKRFIWASERTGWRNYYLYDLSGKMLTVLTKHSFEVAGIAGVDEKAGALYYLARDGANHMMLQLHRVGLDGKKDVRLTDPAFHHTVSLAPDFRHFIDTCQTHDIPPTTRLMNARGKVVAPLATSDLSRFEALGLKKTELFTFTAADGTTELHGILSFPSTFDPAKKYPLLVSVYGGPATNAARETFLMPNPLTELGFLVASFDSRSAAGRGKRFLDVFYGHLGIVEMDDQAAGVKALRTRPYIDPNRVGIFGTSYGGTSSATCLLRFPDVFQAACANSAVTDYRNYDSIYAERNMGLLKDNEAGYDAARVMTYVKNLKGRLMIYYGTADNNVHPSNSLQLIKALQEAGKSFEVQVGPDMGHTAVNQDRMMEFFIENLVLKPASGKE